MLEKEDPRQALVLLKKHLQVQEGEPLSEVPVENAQLEVLRKVLTDHLAWLLDYQFERLLQAMYRIDVNEQEFRAVLTGDAPVAPALAELVLQRELKKVKTRRLYAPVK